jgi:pimeloyl-ACP methyl ester carboxylesterase
VAGRKQRTVPETKEEVRVRRSYFDCRFGQLHVRTAFPPSGGFDEHTTLLCFHSSAAAGRAFHQFLPQIALERSVYAPDAPGCGESDPAPGKPSIADYAAAMVDFIETMRLRQVDVLGHGVGSLVAAELAVLRPEQVRRAILVSVPVHSASERQAPPASTVPHGDSRLADYADAARRYAANERLPLMRQPTLVLRPRDESWEATLQARPLIRGVRVIDMADCDGRIFETAPEPVARHARAFLNEK